LTDPLVGRPGSAYLSSMSKKAPPRVVPQKEEDDYLSSLRVHKRVIEAESEDVPLPAGVTHVLVNRPGTKPTLIEKRKSYF